MVRLSPLVLAGYLLEFLVKTLLESYPSLPCQNSDISAGDPDISDLVRDMNSIRSDLVRDTIRPTNQSAS